jgi:hypothetical protein
MEPWVEYTVAVCSTLTAGGALGAYRECRQASRDAALAVRILTGEEAVEQDRGLVAWVRSLAGRVRRLEREHDIDLEPAEWPPVTRGGGD